MSSVALHVSTDTPVLHPSANGQGLRPASRRTYIRKLLLMAQEMRPYLRQYHGHMVAAAGLTSEQTQVLQALLKDLQDLERLIGRPLFPELYEVKPRRRLLLRPDHDPGHYRGTLHKQQGGLCYYCGARLAQWTTKTQKRASKRGDEWQPAEVDHAVPLCRGGKDEPSNYRLACAHCNQEKGRQTEKEYLAVIAAGIRLVELTPGGRRYWLWPGAHVSIGSTRRHNGIVINHRSVSSRHAELRDVGRLNERRVWVVCDLGSTTGTYVSYNGADAERPVKENALTYGSTVRFGEVCLRLEPGDHRTLADRG